jgi:tRNA modification GTPase
MNIWRKGMEDTISAIATSPGEGGIGIVRISGCNAKKILMRIFVPAKNKLKMPIDNRRLTYGYIVDPDSGGVIDEAMVVYMKAPLTYTREDIVEIQCHGNIVSLQKILRLTLKLGARLADPGEFTKRAFLNGRIDLSQAEAVIDIIRSKSERSLATAMGQLSGKLSEKIGELRSQLMDILVKIAVNIDYPDEDIEEYAYEEMVDSLKSIGNGISELIASADTGRIINEGLKVAIVGKPNVGKSSLLNALLKEQRAIVTEVPGTTRDTIEEGLNLKGIPVYLIDTAGIRSTDDPIEKLGIRKTEEAFKGADLVIFMLDGSQSLQDDDMRIAKMVEDCKVIVVLNKMDLGKQVTEKQLNQILPKARYINASVIEEKGIKELENLILDIVYSGLVVQEHTAIITNARHAQLLEAAKEYIEDAIILACQFDAMDFIEFDVRYAWEALGDILGETVTEDIIDAVFERFCLGK